MTDKSEVTKQEADNVQNRQELERPISPAVDIFEDENGITLQADMPGVSRDRLEIEIDRDTLAIEGKAEIPMPEGLEAIHADVRSTHYRRSFTLSHELNVDAADAALKDGILTLHIPKREQYQPRKIDVQIS
jgi:HSP20 family molecular chaperone IbpA